MKHNIVIADEIGHSIGEVIREVQFDKIFVLTDTTTLELCWPLVSDLPIMQGAQMITIAPTDEAKNLSTLSDVWTALQHGGASRRSLLVNLGGGMLTDLGGFAASTFKRGIQYINVPTTLLAQVDASVGGKTGVNFGGLKNEIGVFSNAYSVIVSSVFLKTLDHANLLSGYAEMLKHGLLSSREKWAELLCYDLEKPDFEHLQKMVVESIGVKDKVVSEDPKETGVRKALNLGHTAAHAIESLALQEGRTVLHGYAVAWGLMMELYLSARKCGFSAKDLHQLEAFVKQHYGKFHYECKHYEMLYNFMTHDKKNENGIVNFTLMGGIGDVRINQTATQEEIEEMLDYYRES